MKASTPSRALTLLPGLLAFLTLAARPVSAQTIQITGLQVTNSAVQFQVQGPTNAYYRVDSSPDLFHWLPVDLFSGASGPHTTSDSFSLTNPAQFYRASQVDPGLEILAFSPGAAAPGGEIEIYGQFLPPLNQYSAQIGGVTAKINSGSSTRLFVTMPANAATGLITVKGGNGSVAGGEALVVFSNAVVRFQPPASLNASNFVVANNYGTGVLIPKTTTDYSLPVREGFPTLSFASVPGQETNLFFCALSFGGDQVVDLNAVSTADALVFQNWGLYTTDPALGPALMALIQTNSAVQAFAQALTTAITQSATPLVLPSVTNSYQAAVLSVLTNEAFAAMAASVAPAVGSAPAPGGPRPLDVTGILVALYPVPIDPPPVVDDVAGHWTELNYQGLSFTMDSPDYYFNPVDWIVTYRSVDVDASFPNGKTDFDLVRNSVEYNPQAYATTGAFYAQRSVAANLFSSKIDLVGLASKALLSLVTPEIDSSVTLPPGDAMYLVRAVGPSFFEPGAFGFVRNQMPLEYAQTLVVNLSSVAFQILGSMTDDATTKNLISKSGDINGLVTSILQQGPIQDVDDFTRAAYTVVQGLISDYLADQVKGSAIAAIQFAAKNAVKVAGLGSIPGQLEAISKWGQVGERALGLFRTTSLETTFITVGDPFSLKTVTVVPSAAAPGQSVTVSFLGSTSLKPFNPGTDKVTFIGDTAFNGQVQAVSGPDASGRQTLTVTVPESVSPSDQGAYTMYVVTQGRQGSAAFTVSLGAALSSVTPLQGFAPAASFNGSPYAGTAVQFQGAVFTATDTFLFAGGGGGVAATNVKASPYTSGAVIVDVPPGAVTGPLKILHQASGGLLTITSSVTFTVLGPPVITSVDPAGGAAIGSLVHLQVSQSGADPTVIYYQFTGSNPQNPIVRADGALLAAVPPGSESGFLTVFTPAGSNQVPYDVSPATAVTGATGATITVGGNSIITLAQALGFIAGTTPTLDQAKSGLSTYNPNLPDFGAPWNLVPPYIVTISGVSGDSVTISNPVLLNGKFTGSLVLAGAGIGASGTFGSVSVPGAGNALYGTFAGPVTISGNNNSVSGSFQSPMVVSGEENSIGDAVSGATFQNVAGDALTITGNYNSVGSFNENGVYGSFGGANCLTNAGDGLVINGGKYNLVAVGQSVGNAGNGVTLTGGAEGNALWIATGVYSNQFFGTPGTGNHGHGLALIGSATANTVQAIGQGLSGNGLDGLYLNGAGVTSNTFNASCTFNGRNGVTMTNGAGMNILGYVAAAAYQSSSILCDYNAGSGVVCAGAGPNQLLVFAQKNGRYGVLLSGVQAPPGGFQLTLQSQGTGGAGNPLSISGNGLAGLRLEKAVTGVQASAILGDDLELDGAGVTGNGILATIFGTVGNGAALTGGASSNALSLGVSSSGADGVLLAGASNNLVEVWASTTNALNGVHLTSGSTGNHIVGAVLPSIYYGADVGNYIAQNVLSGCLVDGGSSNNVIDAGTFFNNTLDGLTLSGAGVTGNVLTHSSVGGNGRDGIRFELGASGNVIGSDPLLNPNSPTDINVGGFLTDGEAGIAITDPATGGNLIQGCSVTSEPAGALVENKAGIGRIALSFFDGNDNGIVLQDGAHDGSLSGLTVQSSTNAGVVIEDAWNVVIGGPGTNNFNRIFFNATGIDISGGMATNNVIENNQITSFFNSPGNDGVYIHDGASQNAILATNLIENYLCGVRLEAASGNLVSQATIQNNQGAGLIIASAATNNLIQGNLIQDNGVGILVSDEGTVGNTITGNSITENSGKGIELSAGGNHQIPPPNLPAYTGLTMDGTATAPDGSMVEIFWNPGDHQGKTFVGGAPVVSGRFSAVLDTDPSSLGFPELSATVTDPSGNTSEFSGEAQNLSLQNLAFTVTNSAGQRQVYYSADGGNPFNLTQAWNPGSDDFSPALPGGVSCDKVLFVSMRAGHQEVFVMEPRTNAQPTQVTTNAAGDYDPAWLAPCQSLVFVSMAGGNPQIYSVDLDGGNLRRLATNSFADVSPGPSLDGTKIAFISNRSGTNALWIMGADGSNPAPLGTLTGTPAQPAFSPDGRTIALAVTRNGVSEIAIIGVDGGGFQQLTSDGAHATHPTWLADGQHIVFSSDRAGSSKLYSINSDGTGLQALPLNPDFGLEPSAGGM